jgi:striatin 1/3/4
MKGRIARLEGSTRKADGSNKSLKKYVNMLEKALKERDSQVKVLKAGGEVPVDLTKEDKQTPAGKKTFIRRKLCEDP